MEHINTATRRNYSEHVLRAMRGGFRPMSLRQFVRFELFNIRGFSL